MFILILDSLSILFIYNGPIFLNVLLASSLILGSVDNRVITLSINPSFKSLSL